MENLSSNNFAWLEKNLQDIDSKINFMSKLMGDVDPSPEQVKMCKLIDEFYNSYQLVAQQYENLTSTIHKNMPELWDESSSIAEDTMPPMELHVRIRHTSPSVRTEVLPAISSKQKKKMSHTHESSSSDSESSSSSSSDSDAENEEKGGPPKLQDGLVDTLPIDTDKERILDAEVQCRLDVLEEENQNLRNELSSGHIMKNILEEKILNLEEKNKEEVSALIVKNLHLADALREGSNCLKEYEKKIICLETSIHEERKEVLNLKEENSRLKNDLKMQQESGMLIMSQVDKLQNEISEMMTKNTQLQSLGQETEIEIQVKVDEIKRLESEITSIRVPLSNMGGLQALADNLMEANNGLQVQLEVKNLSLLKLENEVKELQISVSSSQAECQMHIEAEYAYLDRINELEESLAQVQIINHEAIMVKNSKEQEIEKLHELLEDLMLSKVHEIQKLQESAGRMQDENKALKGQIFVLEAQRTEKVPGEQVQSKEVQILEMGRIISDLHSQLQKCKEDYKTLESIHDKCKDSKLSITEEMNALYKSLDQLQLKCNVLEIESSVKSEKIHKLQDEMNLEILEKSKLGNEKLELTQQVQVRAVLIQRLQDELSQLSSSISRCKNENMSLKDASENGIHKITVLERDIEHLQQQLKVNEEEKQVLTSLLMEERTKMEEVIQITERKNSELTFELQDKIAIIQQLEGEVHTLQEDLSCLQLENENIQHQMVSCSQELLKQKEQTNAFRQELGLAIQEIVLLQSQFQSINENRPAENAGIQQVLNVESGHLQALIKEVHQNMSWLQEEQSMLKDEISAKDKLTANLWATVSSLESERQTIKECLEAMENEKIDLLRCLEDKSTQIQMQEQEIVSLNLLVSQLNEDSDVNAKAKYESDKRVEEMEAELIGCKKENGRLNLKLSQFQDNVISLEVQFLERCTENKMLQGTVHELKSINQIKVDTLKHLESEIFQVQASVLRLEEERENLMTSNQKANEEILILRKHLEQIETNSSSLKQEKEVLESEMAFARARHKKLESDIHMHILERKEIEMEFEKKQVQLLGLEKLSIDLQAQLQEWQEKYGKLEFEHESIGEEKKLLHMHLQQEQKKLDLLEQECDAMKVQSTAATNEVSRLEGERSALQDDLHLSKVENSILYKNVHEYQGQVNRLESLLCELQNRCETTMTAHQMTECLITEIKVQMQSVEEHNTILKEKIYKLQDELNLESLKKSKVENEKLELDQQIQAGAILIQKLEDEVLQLRSSILECESVNLSIKHAYENSTHKVNVLEKDIDHLQQKLTVAEEEKQSLRSVHMEEKGKMAEVIQIIEGKKNEVMAELQDKVASVHQFEGEVHTLHADLSRLQLVNKNIEHEMASCSQECLKQKEQINAYRQNVCELESLVFELRNKCETTKKSHEMAECSILEMKAQTQSVKEQNAILDQKIHKLQDELNSEFLEKSKVEHEKLELNKQIQAGTILIQKLEDDASQLHLSILRFESENISIKQAYENSVQKINVLEKDVEHFQQQLIVAEEEKQVLRSVHMEEKEKMDSAIQNLGGQNNELMAELQGRVARIQELDSQVQNLLADLSRLQLENKKIQHQIVSGSQELLKEKEQTNVLRLNVCEYEKQVNGLEFLVSELQNKCERITKAHEMAECLMSEIKAEVQSGKEHNAILNENIHKLQDELNSESLEKSNVEKEKLELEHQIQDGSILIQKLENEASELRTYILRCERENTSIKHSYENSVQKLNVLEKDVEHLQQQLIVAEEEKEVLRSVHMEEKEKMEVVIEIIKGKNTEILAEVQDKIACIRQLECDVQNLQADLSHLQLENKNIQCQMESSSQELLKEKEQSNALRQNVCEYQEHVDRLESLVFELQNKCETTRKAHETAECLISEIKAEARSLEEHNTILSEEIHKLQDELNSKSLEMSKFENEKLGLNQQIEDRAIVIQNLENEVSQLCTSVLRCESENMSIKRAYESSVRKINVLEKDVEDLQQQLTVAEEEKQVLRSVHMEEKEKMEAVIQIMKGKNDEVLIALQDKITCIRQLEGEVQNLQADLSHLQLENKNIQHQMASGSQELLTEKEQNDALKQNVCEYQEQVKGLESLVFELQNKYEATRKAQEMAECLISEIKAAAQSVEEYNTILNEKIHKLQDELNSESLEKSKLQKEKLGLNQQIEARAIVIQNLENEISQLCTSVLRSERENMSVKHSYESSVHKNNVLEKDVEHLRQQLIVAEEEKQALRSVHMEEKENMDAVIQIMKEKNNEVLAEVQDKVACIRQLECEVQNLQADLSHLQLENENIRHQFVSGSEELLKEKEHTNTLRQHVCEYEKQVNILESLVSELQNKCERTTKALEMAECLISEIKAQVQSSEEHNAMLNEKIHKLQDELTSKSLETSYVEKEKLELEQQIQAGAILIQKLENEASELCTSILRGERENMSIKHSYENSVQKINVLEKDVEHLQQQLIVAEEEKEVLRSVHMEEKEKMEVVIEIIKGKNTEILAEVQDKIACIRQLECDVQNLQADLSHLQLENKNIQCQMESSSQELLKEKEQSNALRQNVCEYQEHVDRLKSLVFELQNKCETTRKAHETAECLISEIKAEARSLEEHNTILSEEIHKLQDELNSKSLEMSKFENEKLGLNQQIEDRAIVIQNLENEVSQLCTSVLRCESENMSVKRAYESSVHKINVLEKDVEHLQQQLRVAEEEKQVLRSFHMEEKEKMEAVIQVMKGKNNEILVALQDKITCIRQLEGEIQNLQADLSHLQLENKNIQHQMASGSQELLTEKEQNDALKQNVCEYQEQVKGLESLVFELQNKYEATRKAQEMAECLISEIKAAAQSVEEYNTILNEKIHKLQDELNSESLEKSKLQKEKLGLNQQIEARAIVIQNLENEISQLCTSVLRSERENMSVKHSYESSVHKNNVLEKDVEHLRQQLIVAEEEKQALRSVHMEEKENMDAVIQIMKEKNNEVLAEVQDKVACIRQLECEVQNLQADLSHLQLENENIRHQFVSGSEELLKEKEHTKTLRQHVCEYEKQVNILESLVSELQSKCERTTEALEMAECLISEIKAQVQSSEEHNAMLNEKVHKLQEELTSKSLETSYVEKEKLELEQQIQAGAILIEKLENEASELCTSILRCERENMSIKHSYENSVQKINVLEKDVEHLQQQLIVGEEEKEVLRSVHMEEKEKMEVVIEIIKGKNTEILAEVQDKIACIRQLECDVQNLQADLSHLQLENKNIQCQMESSSQELLKEKEQSNALRQNVCEYQEHVDRLESLVFELQNKCETTRKAHETAECLISEIKAEARSLEEHNTILSEEIHKLQDELNSKSLEMSKFENEKLGLNQQIEDRAIVIQNLENEVSQLCTSVLRCESENMSVKRAYESSVHKINVLEKDVEHLQQQLTVAEEEKQVLRSVHMEEKEKMEAVIQVMKGKNNEVLIALQDKITCIRQLEGEVQNLQADLSHLQLENKNIQHQMASGSEELLKEKEQNDALKQNVCEYQEQVKGLESLVFELQNKYEATRKAQEMAECLISEIKAAAQSVEEYNTILNEKIHKLQDELNSDSLEKSKLQKEKLGLNQQIEARAIVIQNLENEISQLCTSVLRSERENMSVKHSYESSVHKNNVLEKDVEHLRQQLIVAEEEKQALRSVHMEEKENMDAVIQIMKEKNNEVLAEVQDKVACIRQLECEVQNLQADLSHLQLENENIRHQFVSGSEELLKEKEHTKTLRQHVCEYEKQVNILESLVSELQSKCERTTEALEMAECLISEIKAQVQSSEEHNAMLNEKVHKLQDELTSKSLEISYVEKEKLELEQQIQAGAILIEKLENEASELCTSILRCERENMSIKHSYENSVQKINVLEKDVEHLQQQLIVGEEEKEVLRSVHMEEKEKMEVVIEIIKGKNTEILAEVQDKIACIRQLECDVQNLQADLSHLQLENKNIQCQMESSSQELLKEKEQSNALRQNVCEYQEHVDRLESLVFELQNKCETTRKAHETAECLISEIKAEARSLEEHNTILSEEIHKLQDELNSKSLEMSKFENEKLGLNQQIEDRAIVIQNLENEVSQLCTSVLRCESENMSVKRAYESSVHKINVLEKDVEHLQQQLTVAEEEKQVLRSVHMEEKEKMEAVIQIMKGKNNEVLIALQDKITCIRQLEGEVQNLQADLSHLQSENKNIQHQMASGSEELLKEKEQNNALKQNVCEYQEQVKRLESLVFELQNKYEATRKAQEMAECLIVEEYNTILNEKIHKLQDELNSESLEKSKLEKEKLGHNQQIEARAIAIQNLENEVSQLCTSVLRCERENMSVKHSYESSVHKNNVLEKDVEHLRQQLIVAEEEKQALRSVHMEEKENMDAVIQIMKEKNNEVLAEVQDKVACIRQLECEVQNLQADLSHLQLENENIRHQFVSGSEELLKEKEHTNTLRQHVCEYEKQVNILESLVSELQNKCERTTKALEMAECLISEIKAQVQSSEEHNAMLNEKIHKLQDELTSKSLETSYVEKEKLELEQQIQAGAILIQKLENEASELCTSILRGERENMSIKHSYENSVQKINVLEKDVEHLQQQLIVAEEEKEVLRSVHMEEKEKMEVVIEIIKGKNTEILAEVQDKIACIRQLECDVQNLQADLSHLQLENKNIQCQMESSSQELLKEKEQSNALRQNVCEYQEHVDRLESLVFELQNKCETTRKAHETAECLISEIKREARSIEEHNTILSEEIHKLQDELNSKSLEMSKFENEKLGLNQQIEDRAIVIQNLENEVSQLCTSVLRCESENMSVKRAYESSVHKINVLEKDVEHLQQQLRVAEEEKQVLRSFHMEEKEKMEAVIQVMKGKNNEILVALQDKITCIRQLEGEVQNLQADLSHLQSENKNIQHQMASGSEELLKEKEQNNALKQNVCEYQEQVKRLESLVFELQNKYEATRKAQEMAECLISEIKAAAQSVEEYNTILNEKIHKLQDELNSESLEKSKLEKEKLGHNQQIEARAIVIQNLENEVSQLCTSVLRCERENMSVKHSYESSVHKNNVLEKDVEHLRQQLIVAEEEKQALRSVHMEEKENMDAVIQIMKEKNNEVLAEVQDKVACIRQLECEVQNLQADLSHLQLENENIRHQFVSGSEEILKEKEHTNTLRQHVCEYEKQVNILESLVSELQSKCERTTKALEMAECLISEIKAQVQSSEEHNAMLNEKIHKLQDELTSKSLETSYVEKEKLELEQQIQAGAILIQKLENEASELCTSILRCERENMSIKHSSENSVQKINVLEKDVEHLQRQLIVAEEEKEVLRSVHMEEKEKMEVVIEIIKGKNTEILAEVQDKIACIRQLECDVQNLQADLSHLQLENKNIQCQMESSSQELLKEKEQTRQNVIEYQEQVNRLEFLVFELQNKCETTRKAHETAECLISEIKAEARRIEEHNTILNEKIHKLQDELKAESLEKSKVENEKLGLNQQIEARAIVIQNLEREVSQLCTSILRCETENMSVKHGYESSIYKMNVLEKDVEHLQQQLTVAEEEKQVFRSVHLEEKEKMEAVIQIMKVKNNEVLAEVQDKIACIRQLECEVRNLQADLSHLRLENKNIQHQLVSGSQELLKEKEHTNALRQKICEYEEHVNILNSLVSELQNECERTTKAHEIAECLISEIKAEVQSGEEHNTILNEKIHKLQDELNSESLEKSKLENEKMELNKQIESRAIVIQNLENEVSHLCTSVLRCEKESMSVKYAYENNLHKINVFEKEIEHLQQQLIVAEEEKQALRCVHMEEKEKMEAAIQKLKGQNNEVMAELQGRVACIQQLEGEVQNLQADLSHLQVENKKIQHQMVSGSQELQKEKEQTNALRLNVCKYEEQVNRLEFLVSELQNKCERATKAHEMAECLISEIKAEVQNGEEHNTILNKKILKLQDELNSESLEKSELENQKLQLNQQIEAGANVIKNLEDETLRLRLCIRQCEDENVAIKDAYGKAIQQLKVLDGEIEQLHQQLTVEKEDKQTLKIVVSANLDEKRKMEELMQKIEGENKNLRFELQDKIVSIQDVEYKMNVLQKNMSHLQKENDNLQHQIVSCSHELLQQKEQNGTLRKGITLAIQEIDLLQSEFHIVDEDMQLLDANEKVDILNVESGQLQALVKKVHQNLKKQYQREMSANDTFMANLVTTASSLETERNTLRRHLEMQENEKISIEGIIQHKSTQIQLHEHEIESLNLLVSKLKEDVEMTIKEKDERDKIIGELLLEKKKLEEKIQIKVTQVLEFEESTNNLHSIQEENSNLQKIVHENEEKVSSLEFLLSDLQERYEMTKKAYNIAESITEVKSQAQCLEKDNSNSNVELQKLQDELNLERVINETEEMDNIQKIEKGSQLQKCQFESISQKESCLKAMDQVAILEEDIKRLHQQLSEKEEEGQVYRTGIADESERCRKIEEVVHVLEQENIDLKIMQKTCACRERDLQEDLSCLQLENAKLLDNEEKDSDETTSAIQSLQGQVCNVQSEWELSHQIATADNSVEIEHEQLSNMEEAHFSSMYIDDKNNNTQAFLTASDLQDKTGTLKIAMSAKDSYIINLENKIGSLKEEKNILEERISILDKENKDFHTVVESMNFTIQEHRDEIRDWQLLYSNLQEKCETNMMEREVVQSKILEIEKREEDLKEQNTSLELEILRLQDENNRLKSAWLEKGRLLEILGEENNSLLNKEKELNSRIQEETSQVNNLEREVLQLREHVLKIEEENRNLTAENGRCTDELSVLQQDIASILAERQIPESDVAFAVVSRLESTIKMHVENEKALRDRQLQLLKENSDLRTQINAANGTLQRYEETRQLLEETKGELGMSLSKVQKLQDNMLLLQVENDRLNEVVVSNEHKIQRLQEAGEKLQKENEAFKEDEKALEQMLQIKTDNLDELEKSANDLQEKFEEAFKIARRDMARLEEERDALKVQMSENEAKISILQTDEETLIKQLDTLEEKTKKDSLEKKHKTFRFGSHTQSFVLPWCQCLYLTGGWHKQEGDGKKQAFNSDKEIQTDEEALEKQLDKLEEKSDRERQTDEETLEKKLGTLEEKSDKEIQTEIQTDEETLEKQLRTLEEKSDKEIQTDEEILEKQLDTLEEKTEKDCLEKKLKTSRFGRHFILPWCQCLHFTGRGHKQEGDGKRKAFNSDKKIQQS